MSFRRFSSIDGEKRNIFSRIINFISGHTPFVISTKGSDLSGKNLLLSRIFPTTIGTGIFLVLAVSLFTTSCTTKPKELSLSEYNSFIRTPENGLIKQRSTTGLALEMRYLPVDYLVAQDLESEPRGKVDSLRALYKNSYTFLLTIAPNGEVKGNQDVMYQDIQTIEEYKARAMEMNFSMANYITLRTNKGEVKPVLATLENTYSLTKDRKIYLVFSDKDEQIWENSKEMDITFQDKLFHSGIHHFVFQTADIKTVPQLTFKEE